MAEVTTRQSDESVLDLSVKCGGRISLPRTSSDDETIDQYVKADSEDSNDGEPSRKRPYGRSEAESLSPSFVSGHNQILESQRSNIYRSESDSESRYSSNNSPSQGSFTGCLPAFYSRNHPSPPDEMMRQSSCAMYPVERGSPSEGVAFMQAQSRVMPVPVGYAPEMQGLTRGDCTTLSQHLAVSNLSPPDIMQRQFSNCMTLGYPYPGNFYSNLVAPQSNAVSARIPSPSQLVSNARAPPNPNGVHENMRSHDQLNPKKRFLAKMQNSESFGKSSPSLEPNSSSVLLPSASTSMDEPTPSSSEERKPSQTRTCIQEKDDAYWERRRKNNEAAKRSRDIRRQKEEQVAARAATLSAENIQLRAQIELLKSQLALIQSMALNGSLRPS